MSRQLRKTDYQRLMASVRMLTGQCGGTEGAAELSRVNKVSMSNYGNINKPEMMAPIDVVADLEDFSGDMPVTRALAALQGCVLVKISGIPDQGEISPQLASLGKEVAEFFSRMATDMADGDFSPQEARDGLPEIEDILRVTLGLYEFLKNHGEGDQ